MSKSKIIGIMHILCRLYAGVSDSEQVKGIPLRKCTTKDNFILIGALESLDEGIFVKTSKSNHFFCL